MPFSNDCMDTVGVPPARLRFVTVGQCTCETKTLELVDPRTGESKDLTEFGIPVSSSSSSSISSSSSSLSDNFCGQPTLDAVTGKPKHGVEIVGKALPSDVELCFNVMVRDFTLEDAQNGVVRIPFAPGDTPEPGILCAMAIVWEDGIQRCHFPFYLEITPNLAVYNQSGPLTFYEVRQAMRDIDATSNFLLDSIEYRDEEIMWAMRRPIDYWNEVPPPIGIFSTKTFPFRYHWCEAVVGELLQMNAIWLRRNDLDYSAAGVQVEDTAKWPEYARMARERLDGYKIWVKNKKIEINIAGAYNSLGGYRSNPYR